MPRAIRSAGALALAMLLLVLVPSIAAAAPRWLAPADLTPPGERASAPKVVIGPDGSSTAAWISGGIVRVATRPAGVAAWPAPVTVSAAGASGIVDLVTDPAGNTAVAWTTGLVTVTLHAAVRPAGGAFGAPEDIPGPPAGANFSAFTADGAGGFVAAWSTSLAGPSLTAYVSSRAPGGGWSPAEALSAPGEHALVFDASGAVGRVAVVYAGGPSGNAGRVLKVRDRLAQGGPWAPEGVVRTDAGSIISASVAVGPAGELLAVWNAASGSSSGTFVEAASRPAGGQWGSVENLGSAGATSPKALIEPDGTATVVWGGAGVVARVRPPGAAFGPLQALSPSVATIGPFDATLGAGGPAGGVIAAWATGGSGPAELKVVRAAVKPAGSAQFGPMATVSAPGAVGAPAAAIGPGGEGVAMWFTSFDALGQAGPLHSADYTERPGAVLQPPPVAVRIDQWPRETTEGTMLRLKLAVDGYAEVLPVRLQQKYAGAFRNMGPVVNVTGQTADMQVRLTFPGKLVARLAFESQGKPAFSRSVTILINRPAKPLMPAGTSPKQVAVGLGAVWVLTEDDAGRMVVLRLDQRTGRATADPIPVDGAERLAIGAGAVWVSRGYSSDRGIVRVDPATAKVAAEIPIISSGALAAGPAGVWTVECERRTGFQSGCNEQQLARIDPATNAVGERITVVGHNQDMEPTASGLAVGSRYVWFTRYSDKSRTVQRLDTRSGKIATDGGLGVGLVVRGDAVWGLSGPGGCILVSGSATARVHTRSEVPGRPRFTCSSLAFDGSSVWAVQGTNTAGIDPATVRVPARLVRIDARTARPIGRPIPLGAAPATVDVADGVVWVASGDEGVIRRIVPSKAGARPPAVKPYRPPVLRAPWGRPTTIAGSTATTISGVDLAVGDRGRSAAIWKASPAKGVPSVVSAIRAAGAMGWAPARRLGQGATNSFTGTPRVEMNAAGEAAAVWTSGGSSLANASAQAVLLGPRAEAWSAPATLGAPGTGVDPDVGIASDGSALAVWTCRCGTGTTEISAAARPSGGAFGTPVALGDGGTTLITNTGLAMAPGGLALAAWAPFPGGALTVAARPAGGDFDVPQVLVPPTDVGFGEPRIAVNDAARAVAVSSGAGVFARIRGVEGGWGGPERIAPVGRYSNDGARAAIDGAGNVLVAVRAFDLETFNYRVMIIARRAGAIGWEKPMFISPKGPIDGPPGPSAGEPSIAMNARGDAVIAWAQNIAGKRRVLARLRPAGRLAWRPLEAVSGPEASPGTVAAAIDASAAPTVAWAARVGASSTASQVIRTASRPPLRTAA
ncbi:MAG: hypothetical protein QOD86_351 [Miltoncostaeaceae bacterium]|jgi:hypothetical protein|nr:hypothetical protein [Miltoncostaeaceae bacterium]